MKLNKYSLSQNCIIRFFTIKKILLLFPLLVTIYLWININSWKLQYWYNLKLKEFKPTIRCSSENSAKCLPEIAHRAFMKQLEIMDMMPEEELKEFREPFKALELLSSTGKN